MNERTLQTTLQSYRNLLRPGWKVMESDARPERIADVKALGPVYEALQSADSIADCEALMLAARNVAVQTNTGRIIKDWIALGCEMVIQDEQENEK